MGDFHHDIGREFPEYRDRIHTLKTGNGFHVDAVVLHEQVTAFNQFGTHLLREEGVLKISGVVDTGSQHNDDRFFHFARRQGFQGIKQARRVIVWMLGDQLGCQGLGELGGQGRGV